MSGILGMDAFKRDFGKPNAQVNEDGTTEQGLSTGSTSLVTSILSVGTLVGGLRKGVKVCIPMTDNHVQVLSPVDLWATGWAVASQSTLPWSSSSPA